MVSQSNFGTDIGEIIITDIKQYMDRLPIDHTFNNKWVFRGQRDDWPLVPSLFRFKDKADKPFIPRAFEGWQQFEFILLEKFKAQASPLLAPLLPKNDLDWLAVAQHHDLPTRLLDWTENPLVALYFAVENIASRKTHEHSVVWATPFQRYLGFDIPTLDALNSVLQKNTELFHPTHTSPRIRAQKGCFTIAPLPEGKNEFLPLNKHLLSFWKYIIPNDNREKIKYQLDRIGIDAFTIYPDIDGLSRKITWEIQREANSENLAQLFGST